jgi:putative FmdB family regulatory protein
MAVYEFKCSHCSTITERNMSMKDETHTVPCVQCGDVAHRIISKSTFHLKGGGWYATSQRDNTTVGTED